MRNSNQQFVQFVKQYQASLRSYIRSLGIDAAAVDDIAQETFLLAYRKQAVFDAEQNFGFWLRGIARNLVRNELRKKARQYRIMDEGLTYFLINELENNEQHLPESFTDIKALNVCISHLPTKSRQLIAKKYADECNSKEISEEMAMTSSAVRLALMRIRQKLKDCVKLRTAND